MEYQQAVFEQTKLFDPEC